MKVNQFGKREPCEPRHGIVARREPKNWRKRKVEDKTLTFDAATRIWRGREKLPELADLVHDGIWHRERKESFTRKIRRPCLGITWRPTPDARSSPASMSPTCLARRCRHPTGIARTQTETHAGVFYLVRADAR